jgi:hypothetical protein
VGPGAAYDPRVIERFAEQLLSKADSVRVGSAAVGGILGVIFGAVPLTPLESVWPVPARFGVATMLIGALAGVLMGWVVGEGRAFRYRVQAQMALFQLEIERKVEASLDAISHAPAPAPTSAPAPVAEPAPPPPVAEPASAPVPAPAPVQLPPPLSPLLRPPEHGDEDLPPLSPPVAL